MPDSTPRPAKVHLLEPDLLRGLAALLMLTNHLAVTVLSKAQLSDAFLGSLFFVGSFAPVLFFFVTGMGNGIQANTRKPSRWRSILQKVAILLLADLLMQWSIGRLYGLDFLGFIGLSLLVLEVVRLQLHPVAVCLAGILGLSGLRYLIGPFATKFLGHGQNLPLVNWLLGTTEVPNVSYPLSPWMVYPLLGFVIGAITIRNWKVIEPHRGRIGAGLAGFGVAIALVSFLLALQGSIIFRWGTVSLNFYIASLGVVSLALALALLIGAQSQFKLLQKALSLPGIASLAIVPIHYFLIGLLAQAGIQQSSALSFCLALILLTTISFLLAHGVYNLSQETIRVKRQTRLWLALVTTIVILAIMTILTGHSAGLWSLFAKTAGQILLCLLLTVRSPLDVSDPVLSKAPST